MSGYFFDGIERRRLEDPALDLPAVEARVPDLLRLVQRELPEERVVEGRQLPRPRRRRGVENVQIADPRCARHHEGDPLRARVGGVRHHVVAAAGHRVDLSARDVDALQIGVALLANANRDRPAVAAPDGTARRLPARRALIAAEAAVHVEVVARRQVSRRAAGDVDDPQVGLRVRALRVAVEGADEGQPLAVGREGVGADAAVDADDLRRLAAVLRDREEIAVARVVVRRAAPVGHEEDRRPVR